MHGLMREGAVAAATATVCFGIATTTGMAGRASHLFRLSPGDDAIFSRMDWQCGYVPAHRKHERAIECFRESGANAIAVEVTANEVRVFKDLPQSRAALLYQHPRNP